MTASAGRLLERERELQRIASLLEGALDGAGSMLVVEGPAGIGKTRLSVRRLMTVTRRTDLIEKAPFPGLFP